MIFSYIFSGGGWSKPTFPVEIDDFEVGKNYQMGPCKSCGSSDYILINHISREHNDLLAFHHIASGEEVSDAQVSDKDLLFAYEDEIGNEEE